MKWFSSSTGRSLPLPALQGKVIEVAERNFKVEEHLGDGGFAVIYRVRDLASNEQYALKHVIMNSEEAKTALREEAKIMKKVQGHPNVLSLHSVAFGHEKDGLQDAYMLMDLCKDSLFTYMQKKSFKLDDNEVKTIFLNVCNAVQHLHSQKHPVLHRDIKVENVLRRPNGSWVLCDYGSAKSKTKNSMKYKNVQEEQQEINKTTTPAYRAPEMWDVMMGQKIDEQADIWALGCMLYLMSYGNLPFTGESQLEVMAGKTSFPKMRSEMFAKSIAEMLNVDPNRRPSIDGVIQLIENSNQPILAKQSGDLAIETVERRSSSLTSGTNTASESSSNAQAKEKEKPLSAGKTTTALSFKGERLINTEYKQKLRSTESPIPLPKIAAPKTTVLPQRTFPEANSTTRGTEERKGPAEHYALESPGPRQSNGELQDQVKALRLTIGNLVENNQHLWNRMLALEKIVKSQEQAILELRSSHQDVLTQEKVASNDIQEDKTETNASKSNQTAASVDSPVVTPQFKNSDRVLEPIAPPPPPPPLLPSSVVSPKLDRKVKVLGNKSSATMQPSKASPNRFGGTFWMTRDQPQQSNNEDGGLSKEASVEDLNGRHKRVVSDPPPLDSWHPSIGQ